MLVCQKQGRKTNNVFLNPVRDHSLLSCHFHAGKSFDTINVRDEKGYFQPAYPAKHKLFHYSKWFSIIRNETTWRDLKNILYLSW